MLRTMFRKLCVCFLGLTISGPGIAEWQTHVVWVTNSADGNISLPARLQIVTDSWNRVVAVPYIVYMPEKDRVLMLVSCDYPHRAMVLWSDDQGASWSDPKFVHTDSEGNPDTSMGVALAYLGNGKVTLLAGGRWFSEDFGETWSDSLPVPTAPENKVWNVWDPLLVENDPKSETPERLIETGYTMDYPLWESGGGPGYSQGYIRFSTDEARSWSQALKVPEWAGVSEVALARASNGDLVAGCRTDKPARVKEVLDHFEGLAVSISKDGGTSWSSLLRIYEWGRHHPCLVVMPDGTIVMTYVVRKGYTDIPDGFPRFGVEAIVSRDHGRTWDLDNRYLLHVWTGNRQGENGWWASSQATSTVLLPDGSLMTAFGTGFRSQPGEGGPSPRDVGLVSWRLDDRAANGSRRITDAPIVSDLRNVFDPDSVEAVGKTH